MWCAVKVTLASARPYRTAFPQWVLDLKSYASADSPTNKTGTEQNSHAITRNMHDWNISETGIKCFHFIVLMYFLTFYCLLYIICVFGL